MNNNGGPNPNTTVGNMRTQYQAIIRGHQRIIEKVQKVLKETEKELDLLDTDLLASEAILYHDLRTITQALDTKRHAVKQLQATLLETLPALQ